MGESLHITRVIVDFERLVGGAGACSGTEQFQPAVVLRGRIPTLGDVQIHVIQVVVGVLAHHMVVEVGGRVAPLRGEVAGDQTHRVGCRHSVGGGARPVA